GVVRQKRDVDQVCCSQSRRVEISEVREICGRTGLISQRCHHADYRVGFGNGRGEGFTVLQSDIFFSTPCLDHLLVIGDIPRTKSHLQCRSRSQAEARVRDHHGGNEKL